MLNGTKSDEFPQTRTVYKAKYEQLVEVARTHRVIYPPAGKSSNLTSATPYTASAASSDDRLFGPTVIEATADDPLLREEIFGNILPVVRFPSHAAALRFYEETFAVQNPQRRPLAAYLFSSKKSEIVQFQSQISAGTIAVNNCVTFQLSHLPFGGVGESGLGRYHGADSFECFSHR